MSLESQPSNSPVQDLTPSLIAGLRHGESTAGNLLEQTYRQAMIRFCWGYLGNIDEAEDAVQEVFCKVLKNKQVPDKFRPWIYRIARNHCLNVLRGRARRKDDQALPTDSQLDVDLPGALSRLAGRETRSRALRLVDELPETQREVLRLRYAEGLTRAEIAEVLGIPEKVVKSRLFEGLKRLRQHRSLRPGA